MNSAIQAFGQTGPGNSMHVQHLDGGVFMALPPEGGMAAQWPVEMLAGLGMWLDFDSSKMENPYLITRVFPGTRPTQSMVHTPGDVLDAAVVWARSCVQESERLPKITDVRIKDNLEASDEDVFVVAVAHALQGAPGGAGLVVRNEAGTVSVGLGSGSTTAHLLGRLAGSPKGYFAATLEDSILYVGQRLENDAAHF